MKKFSKKFIYITSGLVLGAILLVSIILTIVFNLKPKENKYEEVIANLNINYLYENYNKFNIKVYESETLTKEIKIKYQANDCYFYKYENNEIEEISYLDQEYVFNNLEKVDDVENYLNNLRKEYLDQIYLKNIFEDYDIYLAYSFNLINDNLVLNDNETNYIFDLHGFLNKYSQNNLTVEVYTYF